MKKLFNAGLCKGKVSFKMIWLGLDYIISHQFVEQQILRADSLNNHMISTEKNLLVLYNSNYFQEHTNESL